MFHAEGFKRKPTSFHASLTQVVGAAQGSHALSRSTYCTLYTEALTKVGVSVLRGCWGCVWRGVLREALIMLKGEVKLRGRK